MQTPNLSTVPDIIGALQNILARSQLIMADLETPYSRSSFATTTNYFAFELKDRSISNIIIEREQQLDAALGEISCLQTVIDSIGALRQQLVQQKDKITQSINLHKRLVSALWRIPTEVLSQIFIHCLPDANRPPPTLKQAPMLLTRVCRQWREVAVGMPGLWCRLSMGEDWQRVALCYDSWFKRSRGRPLSLTLRCDEHHWSKLRSFLQPHINQISSLFLYFPMLARHPEVMIADFAALEELFISMKGWTEAHSILYLPFTLRSLKLRGWVFSLESLSALTPAWARLTNVEIKIHGEPKTLPRLLHLCPDLSSLTIATVFVGTGDLQPFMHTKLQSLRIFHHGFIPSSFNYSVLFNALSLPNLRVFEAREIQPWPHEDFIAFLARSDCRLERLIFDDGMTTTDEQRAEYVAFIPSLEVVETMHSG